MSSSSAKPMLHTGNMAGKLDQIEKVIEVDSIDLKGTDLDKTEKKEVENGAPPTSAQAVRQLQDSGSERRVVEQSDPMMNVGSRRLSPDVHADPRNWQFVEDHSQNDMLSCKICSNVLMFPYLLTCCGHCFCKRCIDRWCARETAELKREKPRCPHCQQTGFKLIKNLDLLKAVRKLKVYCLYRNSGCMWSGKLQEGEIHLQECAFCPIECPNGCREYGKIERRNLTKHMTECPLQSMECPYRCIGCKSEGSYSRKIIQAHSSKEINHHLIVLAKSNIRLHEEYDIALATLRSNHDELVKEKTQKINSQKQELALLEQTIKSLEADLSGLMQRTNLLKETEDANRAMCTAQFNAKSEEARGLQDICQVTLAEVQALSVPQTASIRCPPVTFTIDNFNSRKILNEQWLSPPFYTHCGGYKMCVAVHPNGFQEAQGNHVSIFFHMMSGEFDDHLQWPFPGAVINISALNQRNAVIGGVMGSKGNCGDEIMLVGQETQRYRSRVYNGSFGPGYGRRKYIPHSLLNQYLAGDLFKIVIYHFQFLPL